MSHRCLARRASIVVVAALGACAPARPSPTRAAPASSVVPPGELCACLADDGRDLPFPAHVCGSPGDVIGPAVLSGEVPVPPATREALVAWIDARLVEYRDALAAIDRAIGEARRVRDVIWLAALSSVRSRMEAVIRVTHDRRDQLPDDAAGLAHAAAVQSVLAQHARSLVAEARNAVAVECSCPDWSARAPTSQRAQVLVSLAIDPAVPMRLASGDLSMDGRPVPAVHHADDHAHRPGSAVDSRSEADCSPEVLGMGLLAPGPHVFDAVLTLAPRRETPWVEYRYPVVRIHHAFDAGRVGTVRLRVEVAWAPHAATAEPSLHTRVVVH